MRRHGWAAIPAWLGHVRGCSCLLVRDPGPLLTAGAWAVVSHSAGAALLSGQTQGTWQSVCLSIYPSGHATWRGDGTEVLPSWLLLQGGLWYLSSSQSLVLGAENSTPRQVCSGIRGMSAGQQRFQGLLRGIPFPRHWWFFFPSEALLRCWIAARNSSGRVSAVHDIIPVHTVGFRELSW